ncbi:hypothetical protein [Actinomadura miaoliensis]|uniref:Uncharacterized protein n=1 Tax=Actinomadura miaoliensis TaxID=430685 RepID=A0ABP7WB78_9ACTN
MTDNAAEILVLLPDGTAPVTRLGLADTLDEAETQFVEVCARLRWAREHGRGYSPQDADDRNLLGDALMHTLGIDLAELYNRYAHRIDATYRRFCEQITAR